MKDMVAATTRSGEDELDPTRTSPDSSGHHQIRRGEARSGEDEPGSSKRVRRRGSVVAQIRRAEGRWVDGLSGPVDGLTELIHGFSFFCFFIRFTEASRTTALVKVTINRDLSTASVNSFCPPR